MLKHRLLTLAGWPVKPRSRSHVYRYTDCTPMGFSKKQPALNSEKQNRVSLSSQIPQFQSTAGLATLPEGIIRPIFKCYKHPETLSEQGSLSFPASPDSTGEVRRNLPSWVTLWPSITTTRLPETASLMPLRLSQPPFLPK